MKLSLKKTKLSTESTIAITLAVVLVLLSVFAAIRHSDAFNKAQEKNNSATTSNVTVDGKTETKKSNETAIAAPEKSTNTPTKKSANGTADFTAVAGDSYTGFARQAISDYAAANNISLTASQQLNAEVTITNNAGSPQLEIGQTVSIEKADIAKVLQEMGADKTATAKSASTENNKTTTSNDFTAQVAAGDSYTAIARSAVAKELSAQKKSFTPAQNVAAETFIAEAAGFPEVEVGQTITISAATLTSAINRAAALTVTSQAAWQPYADTVVW